MPLKAGKKNMGSNIKEMMEAGHPQKQAVAAAYAMARKHEHGFYTHQDVSKAGKHECVRGKGDCGCKQRLA